MVGTFGSPSMLVGRIWIPSKSLRGLVQLNRVYTHHFHTSLATAPLYSFSGWLSKCRSSWTTCSPTTSLWQQSFQRPRSIQNSWTGHSWVSLNDEFDSATEPHVLMCSLFFKNEIDTSDGCRLRRGQIQQLFVSCTKLDVNMNAHLLRAKKLDSTKNI